ncbi:RiPP maturation radical SAM C-methyltransferase [Streptomyces sp. NPDC097617]|uniref:RiPP maturation radical SAM C-methyltransferase n=1 Tax=Streptomyces sp. NPDC097617 TaxID=3366091 RepID=UPI00380C5C50
MVDLLLVNSPFAATNYPSIQLGLVQSLAQERGVAAKSWYANLLFSKRIGSRLYDLISDHRGIQIGDWIFTRSAFPEFDRPSDFLAKFEHAVDKLCVEADITRDFLVEIREAIAPDFIHDASSLICEMNPKVVGFTSTFEQNVAGLALARAVKRSNPDIITLFGGANFDGDMGREYFRAFDWIDFAVVGEVEPCMESLLFQVGLTGEGSRQAVGLLARKSGHVVGDRGRATYQGSMDLLPMPTYDDYFSDLSTYGYGKDDLSKPVTLPFEGSRGCWWGQKHHCTFCGLNGMGMSYRQKTAGAILEEISGLASRHGISNLSAVDNIMSLEAAGELLGRLEEREAGYNIFYEVKANLKKERIRDFANAGIRQIQPGIESLSSRVLNLMNKGIAAIQNVNTLKWCMYYGVGVSWNLLYGFPGERMQDYDDQLAVMQNIPHLPPPSGGGRIWLERFSPYFTGKAAGFTEISPEPSFDYVYPSQVDRNKAAYFFQGFSPESISDAEFEETEKAIQAWRAMWANWKTPPYLVYSGLLDRIRIYDGRYDPEHPEIVTYKDPAASLLRFCGDAPRGMSRIRDHLAETVGAPVSEASIHVLLERFEERGLVLRESDRYLFLAVPLARPRK